MASSKSGGIGCLGVIGIVFIVLKVLGVAPVASWSWWWVLSPYWGPVAAIILLAAIAAVLGRR